MKQMLFISLAYFVAYLIGAFPTGVIAGKLKGIDIRKHGSGNAGATNALRLLGPKIGISVMLIDAFKGILAILLGRLILSSLGHLSDNLFDITLGITAIVGHVFSLFLKFKGGKGVATAAGVFGLLSPWVFLTALLVFIITVSLSKYVSLGSILASIFLVLSQLYISYTKDFQDLPILVLTLLVALFIIIKHRQNIKRLIAGNENKLILKKNK